ncbi:unnamed protein product [Discosporangium mesarthrocarpum]
MKMLYCEVCLMDPSIREAKKFRREFRLPFPFYTKLVEDSKRKHWFGRAGCTDAVGRQAIPFELKLSIFSRSASDWVTVFKSNMDSGEEGDPLRTRLARNMVTMVFPSLFRRWQTCSENFGYV